jgi:hypothetical protein
MRPFDVLYPGCPWVRVQADSAYDATLKAWVLLATMGECPTEANPRRVDDIEQQRAVRAW